VTSRSADFRERGLHGALWAPAAFVLYALLVLLGLLIAAWCIDWIFVCHVWPAGVGRLRAILEADLAWTATVSAELNLVQGWPVTIANTLYAIVFEATGIHGMAQRFAEGQALSIPDTIARSSYIAHREFIETAMLGTQLFGIRLGMMITCLPLGVLVYVLGAADGLVARAVRRARGGAESSSLYHRFKSLQLLGTAGVISICLLWPASLDPRVVWFGAAVPMAVLVRMQWLYYKKHL